MIGVLSTRFVSVLFTAVFFMILNSERSFSQGVQCDSVVSVYLKDLEPWYGANYWIKLDDKKVSFDWNPAKGGYEYHTTVAKADHVLSIYRITQKEMAFFVVPYIGQGYLAYKYFRSNPDNSVKLFSIDCVDHVFYCTNTASKTVCDYVIVRGLHRRDNWSTKYYDTGKEIDVSVDHGVMREWSREVSYSSEVYSENAGTISTKFGIDNGTLQFGFGVALEQRTGKKLGVTNTTKRGVSLNGQICNKYRVREQEIRVYKTVLLTKDAKTWVEYEFYYTDGADFTAVNLCDNPRKHGSCGKECALE